MFLIISKFEYFMKTILIDLWGTLLQNPQTHPVEKIIKELNFPRDATIGGVIRDGKGYVALGDFKIQPDDKVVVSCLADAVSQVEKFFD